MTMTPFWWDEAPVTDDGPGPITCDRCDLPVVTQVTDRFSFGLYCRAHGAEAEAARQDRIRQANNAARRRR